jgi:hypothetical protein
LDFVGAPLFMPPTLRSRTEHHEPVPSRSAGPQTAPLDSQTDERHALDNALLGWIAVAAALSVGSFIGLLHARGLTPGDSLVTTWVAGVAMTLALGPCVLCAALTHRDLRRWWGPIAAVAIPGLLVLYLVMRLS